MVSPNTARGGGGPGYEDQETTQPSSVVDVQPGMFLKLPPTRLPVLTTTEPPKRIAESIRLRSVAFGSICCAISLRSTNAPCECPISTNGRPWL